MADSDTDTEYYDDYVGDDYFYEDDYSKSDDPKVDMEYLQYEEMKINDVEIMINKTIDELASKIKVTFIIAKMILISYNWSIDTVTEDAKKSVYSIFAKSRLLPDSIKTLYECQKMKNDILWHSYATCLERINNNIEAVQTNVSRHQNLCEICYHITTTDNPLTGLVCGHQYCRNCWSHYFHIQLEHIRDRKELIECMGNDCQIVVTEDMILDILQDTKTRCLYKKYQFNIVVESHPQLRFCTNSDCIILVFADKPQAKRVRCSNCTAEYCFKCGLAYHAPTSCRTVKQWLLKCRDDWETANYITAFTKDCPNCGACIEKNGGCNHMMCFKCKHNFCWMCLQDWKTHQAEYYECSRYKENPNTAKASEKAQARDSLRKYLFYYERYENHERSLRLEDQQYLEIKGRIDSKVKSMEGTWIDWQYLLDGASTLLRCRYTLKYTYPYAYYMEKSSRKELFEYQQSILEREVEDLAWRIQNATISDRKQLEAKMNQCEMYRKNLIQDFIEE